MVWDTQRLRMVSQREVEPARIVRVEFEIVGDVQGQRMVVYGVYMPVRTAAAEATEVKRVWDKLIHRVTCDGPNTWVIGDINAETQGFIARKQSKHGRTMQDADRYFARLRAAARLQLTAQGRPTHRAGGEIDHVLAPEHVGCLAGRARIEPGVGKRGGDHIVVTICSEH